MSRRRILLLVDFKYRDLPGLALLKVLLEEQGPYEVFLVPNVPNVGERLYLHKIKPHLVVFSQFLNQSYVDRAYRLRRLGIGVVILPSEGTAYTEEGRLWAAGNFVDLSPVDLFFIWNEGIAELVRARGKIAPERCVVAGVPRFDLYHPRFRSVLLSKEQFCNRYGIDPRRPIVTWATNFAWAGHAGNPDKIAGSIRHYRTQGLLGTPIYKDIPALIERDFESRRILTRGVLRIARDFPDVTLVIKLHPAEESDYYRQEVASAGLKNVTIVSREYIWNVLNATDLHLHRSCTTAIEAWLMDKPTIELQFAPQEWYCAKEILPGGDVAYTLEACLDQVRYYLRGGSIPTEQKSARPGIIEWFCGPVDGQSAQRHVKRIDAWLRGGNRVLQPIRRTREDLRFALTAQIKSLLGLQYHHSTRLWLQGRPQDTREKYFTPDDERTWVQAIRQEFRRKSVSQGDLAGVSEETVAVAEGT